MPLEDRYGNVLTTASADAMEQYNSGMDCILAGQYGAMDAFEGAVTADPAFALAHAGLARAKMMTADMSGAKAALATAQEHVAHGSACEKSHVAALALLLSGKAADARAAVRAHVQDYPRDALAAQLCSNVFGLIGFSGKVGREAELLAYTSALLPHYGEDWWMLSMHALSLCETGQIEASMTLMERALALNPRNANASHFKAHAQYEAGETAAGRAYLADWMQDYDPRGLLHGHLTWHQALWALHDGDATEMWTAVDRGIAPGTSHSLPINVLTDTAAIYHRAELAGIDVPTERWALLSDYAAKTFAEPGQSFVDIHAALAHAMAGQGDRLARITDAAKGFAADLVRPVARAWGAIAREDWQEALTELTSVMATTERLGGSRAQRDLIELSYVNVLLKLGLTEEAHRTLAQRRPALAVAPPVAGYA